MAGANLPAKKYKKTSPTVTRLSFEFDGGSTQFIDIGKALSIINRKFYRAGVYYYVNSVEIYNNETGVVDLHTLPDTWVTKNAWNRGFRLFQKMNSMVDEPISGAGRPAYHDFKVYMSELHKATGSANPQMYGINATNSWKGADDWVYSEFVSADDDGDGSQQADNFTVHMLGPHQGTADNWISVGLIKSYAESRVTVEPDSPEDNNINNADPLLNIFDFSSEEQMNDIIINLRGDNDAPPYDQDNYIGETANDMQHVARIGTEVGVGRVGRASGFCAPFGLICVDPITTYNSDGSVDEANSITTAFRVVLNLAQGTYHGVYGERA